MGAAGPASRVLGLSSRRRSRPRSYCQHAAILVAAVRSEFQSHGLLVWEVFGLSKVSVDLFRNSSKVPQCLFTCSGNLRKSGTPKSSLRRFTGWATSELAPHGNCEARGKLRSPKRRGSRIGVSAISRKAGSRPSTLMRSQFSPGFTIAMGRKSGNYPTRIAPQARFWAQGKFQSSAEERIEPSTHELHEQLEQCRNALSGIVFSRRGAAKGHSSALAMRRR